MTVREALREPISLQALICLMTGIVMGMGFVIAPAVIASAFGPPVKCEVLRN